MQGTDYEITQMYIALWNIGVAFLMSFCMLYGVFIKS